MLTWSSRLITLTLTSFLFWGCSTSQKPGAPTSQKTKANCEVTRAAIDIGSGATRLKVAKVDRCKSKVLTVHLEREERVDYKEDLLKNKSSSFSEHIMNEGLAVLKSLKLEAEKFAPSEYVSVASDAFRESKNGQKFIERINVELWINPRIISQNEEALLGFYGSADSVGSSPENTVIWDIGGSSQQLIKYNGQDRFTVYEGKLGAVAFKDYILRRIKRQGGRSPNPLNSYQIKLAVEHAKQTAEKTVKKDIKEFLKNSSNVKVLGIGGVHYYSLRKQIDPSGEKDTYTIGDVEKVLQANTGKTDADLGNPKYADTDVSNLALVFGFMKALNIYEVKTAKVNMTDGLLLNHKYWAP